VADEDPLGWGLLLRVFAMRQKYLNLLCILRFFPHVSAPRELTRGGRGGERRTSATWNILSSGMYMGGVLMATFAEDVEIFREPLSPERRDYLKRRSKEMKKEGGEGSTDTNEWLRLKGCGSDAIVCN